jgi:hypothetical protein
MYHLPGLRRSRAPSSVPGVIALLEGSHGSSTLGQPITQTTVVAMIKMTSTTPTIIPIICIEIMMGMVLWTRRFRQFVCSGYPGEGLGRVVPDLVDLSE